MTRFNEFLSHIDLSAVHSYCMEHGSDVAYPRGSSFACEGEQCRYVGILLSGYMKYVSLDTDGNECVTGFSFAGEVVTDFVRGFLFAQTSLTSIVAGSDAVVRQVPMAVLRRYMAEQYPDFKAEASSVLLREAYGRYLAIHTKSPAERYAALLLRHHGDIAMVPMQELASYLLVSRRHFQRIRDSLDKH